MFPGRVGVVGQEGGSARGWTPRRGSRWSREGPLGGSDQGRDGVITAARPPSLGKHEFPALLLPHGFRRSWRQQ